jgi:hypothetical protein
MLLGKQHAITGRAILVLGGVAGLALSIAVRIANAPARRHNRAQTRNG